MWSPQIELTYLAWEATEIHTSHNEHHSSFTSYPTTNGHFPGSVWWIVTIKTKRCCSHLGSAIEIPWWSNPLRSSFLSSGGVINWVLTKNMKAIDALNLICQNSSRSERDIHRFRSFAYNRTWRKCLGTYGDKWWNCKSLKYSVCQYHWYCIIVQHYQHQGHDANFIWISFKDKK